jgi:hypothetical protein
MCVDIEHGMYCHLEGTPRAEAVRNVYWIARRNNRERNAKFIMAGFWGVRCRFLNAYYRRNPTNTYIQVVLLD